MEVCTALVRVKAPPAISAAAPLGSVKSAPSSLTTGPPTTEAVRVSPTSASLTVKLPVIGERSCAEASPSSSTAAGSVVSESTGPSFTPAICTVAVAQLRVPLPSRIA